MGLLKEFFSNLDEPAVIIRWGNDNNEEATQLIQENKELKKQLEFKKVNAIDASYKLLE